MKATFITSVGRVSLVSVKKPNPGPGEIVVALRACGICGTDIEKVLGKAATPPVLGHEVVGEVESIGAGINGFAERDRVFVHHHVSCGRCHYCRFDSPTMCPVFTSTNLDPCGLSEYFRVPKANVERGAVMKLPRSVSDEDGVFIEPLACCLRSLSKCKLAPGFEAVVVGAGPMGLLHVKLLRALGSSKIIAVEPIELRRQAAHSSGADVVIDPLKEDPKKSVQAETEGRGGDLVVVAVGSASALSTSLQFVRRGGTVVVFGAPHRGSTMSIDAGSLFYDEISVISSYSTTEHETRQAVKLIESRRIRASDMITHRYGLADVAEAIETAANPSISIKTIVKGRP